MQWDTETIFTLVVYVGTCSIPIYALGRHALPYLSQRTYRPIDAQHKKSIWLWLGILMWAVWFGLLQLFSILSGELMLPLASAIERSVIVYDPLQWFLPGPRLTLDRIHHGAWVPYDTRGAIDLFTLHNESDSMFGWLPNEGSRSTLFMWFTYFFMWLYVCELLWDFARPVVTPPSYRASETSWRTMQWLIMVVVILMMGGVLYTDKTWASMDSNSNSTTDPLRQHQSSYPQLLMILLVLHMLLCVVAGLFMCGRSSSRNKLMRRQLATLDTHHPHLRDTYLDRVHVMHKRDTDTRYVPMVLMLVGWMFYVWIVYLSQPSASDDVLSVVRTMTNQRMTLRFWQILIFGFGCAFEYGDMLLRDTDYMRGDMITTLLNAQNSRSEHAVLSQSRSATMTRDDVALEMTEPDASVSGRPEWSDSSSASFSSSSTMTTSIVAAATEEKDDPSPWATEMLSFESRMGVLNQQYEMYSSIDDHALPSIVWLSRNFAPTDVRELKSVMLNATPMFFVPMRILGGMWNSMLTPMDLLLFFTYLLHRRAASRRVSILHHSLTPEVLIKHVGTLTLAMKTSAPCSVPDTVHVLKQHLWPHTTSTTDAVGFFGYREWQDMCNMVHNWSSDVRGWIQTSCMAFVRQALSTSFSGFSLVDNGSLYGLAQAELDLRLLQHEWNDDATDVTRHFEFFVRAYPLFWNPILGLPDVVDSVHAVLSDVGARQLERYAHFLCPMPCSFLVSVLHKRRQVVTDMLDETIERPEHVMSLPEFGDMFGASSLRDGFMSSVMVPAPLVDSGWIRLRHWAAEMGHEYNNDDIPTVLTLQDPMEWMAGHFLFAWCAACRCTRTDPADWLRDGDVLVPPTPTHLLELQLFLSQALVLDKQLFRWQHPTRDSHKVHLTIGTEPELEGTIVYLWSRLTQAYPSETEPLSVYPCDLAKKLTNPSFCLSEWLQTTMGSTYTDLAVVTRTWPFMCHDTLDHSLDAVKRCLQRDSYPSEPYKPAMEFTQYVALLLLGAFCHARMGTAWSYPLRALTGPLSWSTLCSSPIEPRGESDVAEIGDRGEVDGRMTNIPCLPDTQVYPNHNDDEKTNAPQN